MTKALFTTPEALIARATERGKTLSLPDAERLVGILGDGVTYAERDGDTSNDLLAFSVAVETEKAFRRTGPKPYIGEEYIEDTLRERADEPITDVLIDLVDEHREIEKNWDAIVTDALKFHPGHLISRLLNKKSG